MINMYDHHYIKSSSIFLLSSKSYMNNPSLISSLGDKKSIGKNKLF